MGGTFWLITLYNQTVNLNHEISAAKAQLDTIGAENTAINNKIVTMLGDTDQLTAMATSDGLVVDARPQYVTARSKIAMKNRTLLLIIGDRRLYALSVVPCFGIAA